MSFSFTLQIFAIMLLLICIAIAPLVLHRDPAPIASIVKIDLHPRPPSPGALTQISLAGLFTVFVLLLASCYLMFD